MSQDPAHCSRYFLPGQLVLVLMSGCITAPTLQAVQKPTLLPATRPDPLHALHCIRFSNPNSGAECCEAYRSSGCTPWHF